MSGSGSPVGTGATSLNFVTRRTAMFAVRSKLFIFAIVIVCLGASALVLYARATVEAATYSGARLLSETEMAATFGYLGGNGQCLYVSTCSATRTGPRAECRDTGGQACIRCKPSTPPTD